MVHNQSHLLLVKLISVDVLKQLTLVDLLHHDPDFVLAFKDLFHLDYIIVSYHFDDLKLFSDERHLHQIKFRLVHQFHSHDLLGVIVLALINCRKLPLAEL